MLSLANSSDPSCSSSKVSGFRADAEQFPLQEPDPVVRFGEARASNFSIRDHVFALRNKSIGKSWPFPSQLLQVCLKHGIHDLLPPFEPPNSVRSHCFIRSVSAAQKVTVSSSQLGETEPPLDGELNSSGSNLPSNQNDLLKFSDKDEVRCLREEDKFDHNLVNNVCEIGSSDTNHSGIEILKSGVHIPETIAAEEASSTSTASDSMASKLCPVCKAFSSTSNTTLNAHMDQCLSMDSDLNSAADKMSKLKLKPKKKRMMEDIYAAAPRCTLEDLDRRNGSSWATNLTAAAMSAETNSEPKKPKLSRFEARDEKNDEGAVYVDSNGIKLRILSKFNDAPPQVLSREEFRPRKNITSVQDGKIILMKKMKHFGSADSKKMKLKMRNKKLSSLKLFKNEVQAEAKVFHHGESHLEDEESPVQSSGGADQNLNFGSVTLKNWPSSKRSDLHKKVVVKNDFHKISEHPKSDTRMEMLETRKPSSDAPFSSKCHFGTLSQLLESKSMEFPSNTVQNEEIQETSSQRWSGFSMGRKQKFLRFSKTNKRSADQTYHLSLKTKRASTPSGSNSGAIKVCKHQSVLARTDRRVGERRSAGAVISGQYEELADQHTHSESIQCQDSQTRMCGILADQNLELGTLENTNALICQEEDLQPDRNDKAKLKMPIHEDEMLVLAHVLHDKATLDNLENGGVESQAKAASAQESSACLSSHGDLRLDIPIALDPSVPNQETKLVSCREPSISPASSASTISPATPNYDFHSKASVLSTAREKSGFPSPLMAANEGTRGIDMERNQQVELDSTVKKLQQLSDYHPCCCSWQSIMDGNTPPTKLKHLPNLHIRPSISSFYAYSSLRTDGATTASLESPTESILTRACSDVGSTSPSSGTPTQSSSNSILRLMGKDLMVVHNEESSHLPNLHSPATDNNSNVQALPSPLGFASYASVSKQDGGAFSVGRLRDQLPSSTSLQVQHCLPSSFYQKNMNQKAYTTKEVIEIDDSDDVFAPRKSSPHVPVSHTMFQRPFSYFPQHSYLLPKDNNIQLSNPSSHGSSVAAPHFPTPFAFQSPSGNHMNNPFYYPQSLR